VSRIFEPEMTAEERQALHRTAEVLRGAVDRMIKSGTQRGAMNAG
jgi:hypothetical protein